MTSTKKDPVLAVLQLSGGNDALNTIVPYGDPLYADNRPSVRVPEDMVLKIDDNIGFNPALAPLKDLYDQGKVAIVTGGSKGIGKAIALELAKEGVDVAIASRSKGPLEKTAKELSEETGRKITPIVADMTIWDDVQNMVETTLSTLGKVDILINNAAMVGGQVKGTLAEATEKDMSEDLDTKVVGYFRCMKAVVPHMQKQKWGRIICISSICIK